MDETSSLSREDKIGLLVAGVAHVALAAALLVQAGFESEYTPQERITVSLASEVSLQSTAPDPSAEPAAALAPVLGDTSTQEVVEPIENTVPDSVRPAPAPVQPRQQQPTPQRTSAPTPTPTPRATQTQAPRPQPRPTQTSSGSRIDSDFMQGVSDSTGTQGQAAEVASPQVRSSIVSSINRQLKPHWNPPSGVGVEQLVTVVSFKLNRDGSLSGTPRVLRTNGQNDNNRAQVGRHQEQAIRAVRLAAPFNLPETYYSVWRDLEWNFDNRLAQ